MVDYLVRLSASSLTLFLHLLVSCICCRLSVTLIARLGLNLQRAGAPPPTRTEDLDSTELDVIRFKDPRPPQSLEEATVDDQDFELAAERENARVEVGLSEQQELNLDPSSKIRHEINVR